MKLTEAEAEHCGLAWGRFIDFTWQFKQATGLQIDCVFILQRCSFFFHTHTHTDAAYLITFHEHNWQALKSMLHLISCAAAALLQPACPTRAAHK